MRQQLLIRELSNLLADYETQLNQFDRLLPNFPKGFLRVRRRKEKTLFYRVCEHEGIKKETAISSDTPDGKRLLQMLLEKHIAHHGMPILRKNIKAIKKLLSTLRIYHPDLILTNPPDSALILPNHLYLPGQLNASQWIADTNAGRYQTNPYHPENRKNQSRRGRWRRSKSECSWDDALSDVNALFRYESALKLKDGRIIYPDFTVFLPKERRLVFIEHFGQMDNPQYAMESLRRLQAYAESGYILGRDVFFTMETKELPLTNSQIEAVMHRIGLLS